MSVFLHCRCFVLPTILAILSVAGWGEVAAQTDVGKTETANSIVDSIRRNCVDCHSSDDPDGGLDLTSLCGDLESGGFSGEVDLKLWIKIHDRVAKGEMPPDDGLDSGQREDLIKPLSRELTRLDREQIRREGRAVWRRMNRFEYENSVRDLLSAPWLQVASILPEDGESHRFNKLGEALDVSHVSMARYIQASQYALREVMAKETAAPDVPVIRHYARDQSSFNRRVHFTVFNRSSERATFPLIGHQADLRVLKNPDEPFTVGDADSDTREREAFGVVASSYEPIEIRFSEFEAPQSGRYKLRFKGYTFWAGVVDQKRFRADRENVSIGRRSEPVVIYSQLPPRQLRRLGQFDFQIEPSVQELDVFLLKGESIQPDAVRLFRSRPPRWRNPLATADGMPGVAFSWMEVEGPIADQWPSAGHELLFGDLPIERDGEAIVVRSDEPLADAKRLIKRFASAAYLRPPAGKEIKRFVGVVRDALDSELGFTEAMLAGYTAVLCSPGFLCMEESPGPLSQDAIAARLSLFLWNSKPDQTLRRLARNDELSDHETLRRQVHRMLDDPRSQRFVEAFLAYWLDLRKINDTSPDELLYPDYYLDDSLVDASLEETRRFFAELIREDLPVRNLVDSDFTFANERLAKHYGLEPFEGVDLRRVRLPETSVRGGLLTQASVLKVTANGTTTSPVVRGGWINERILGVEIPAPPPSVPAIEPDTRGATTVREQLRLHRADQSCNACHKLIDPAGFALESFDAVGGFRQFYRSLGDGDALSGFGKNGQPFAFTKGPDVDASGVLPDGRTFDGIREFKQLLLEDERQIARNLVEKLITYSTGAAPRFSDREEIRSILDRNADKDYPVRSLMVDIVTSRMFLNK